MNLEDLKAKLNDLDRYRLQPEDKLEEVRQNVMKSRQRFGVRDVREFCACVIVFVIFWPYVFSEMPWMTRLGSLISCTAAVFISLSLYLGRRRHRVWPEFSVCRFLEAEILHLDYQIRLLRSVSWWYLAPCAVGCLLFVWGLMPTQQALVVSCGYFVVDRVIYWNNQRTIRKDLVPQQEELVRVFESLNDGAEVNSVPE